VKLIFNKNAGIESKQYQNIQPQCRKISARGKNRLLVILKDANSGNNASSSSIYSPVT